MAEPRGRRFYEYEAETGTEERETEHRSRVRILHGNGDLEFEPYEKSARESALVVDGSGYSARLIVLPTFGCVLHEPATERHTEEKMEP